MISGDFRTSFEISGYHSRFQDFSKEFKDFNPDFNTRARYTFVSFNASASMNEGYSSRFVFRYGTVLTAMGRCVTAMGQVFHSLAKSLIASEISVCLPCVHIRVGGV